MKYLATLTTTLLLPIMSFAMPINPTTFDCISTTNIAADNLKVIVSMSAFASTYSPYFQIKNSLGVGIAGGLGEHREAGTHEVFILNQNGPSGGGYPYIIFVQNKLFMINVDNHQTYCK